MTARTDSQSWTLRYLHALPEAVQRECQEIAGAVRAAGSWQPRRKAASRMARALFHQSQALVQRHLKVYPERAKPACSRGCGYCCYGTKVDVTVPEAAVIVEYQRERSSAEEFASFRSKVLAEAERVRPMNLEQRALDRAPCVLLDVPSGECSVYEVRPLACRQHHSFDVQACQRSYEDPAGDHIGHVDPIVQRDGQLSHFALQHALASQGLDEAAYELTNALAVTLSDENAVALWQKGQPVFQGARLPSDAEDREWVAEHGLPGGSSRG